MIINAKKHMLLIFLLFIVPSQVLGTEVEIKPFLGNVARLLGVPFDAGCSLVSIGMPMVHDIPTIHLDPSMGSDQRDLDTILGIRNEFNYFTPNKCFFVIMNGYTKEKSKLVADVSQILKIYPTAILVADEPDDWLNIDRVTNKTGLAGSFATRQPAVSAIPIENFEFKVPITWLRIHSTNFVDILCATCDTVHRGFYNKRTKLFSHNLEAQAEKGLCCNILMNKHLRVSYTTFPPYFEMRNMYNYSTLNNNTLEYYYLRLFMDKYKMTWVFHDENFQWGSWENDTQTWNGVVGAVGYNESDVGISSMGYSAIRNTHVDYTHHLLPMHFRWISKAPGKIAPYKNILYCFDTEVWIAFLVTTTIVSFFLLFVVKAGKPYGVYQSDPINIIMKPLGIINAEDVPVWFENLGRTTWLGAAGRLTLLNWGLMSMMLMFAFSCNMRAIFLRTNYEKPIDTVEDVVKSGLGIQVALASWITPYLKTSGGKWEQMAGNNLLFYSNSQLQEIELRVAREGKDVSYRTTIDFYGRFTSGDPRYKNLPKVHFSKEIIRPYYTGWVVQKMSPLINPVNRHILLIHQAGLITKPVNEILDKAALIEQAEESGDNLEPLSMPHLMGIYVLYIVGLAVSCITYMVEVFYFYYNSDESKGQHLHMSRDHLITSVLSLVLCAIVGAMTFLFIAFE